MQFRFAGDETGPFWDKPQFNGRMPDPKSDQWGNFGGDKTWPSPQGEWPSIIKRGWPPPPAFDSMSVEAKTEGDAIILTSPVDPFYGIRTVRRITLDAEKPVMHISTAYEKVSGEERRVSIWTITQLRDPVLVAAPIKPNTAFATGYTKQSDALPQGLQRTNNLMVMTRSPKDSSKIGMDSESLLWIGANTMVRIDSPRQAAGTYPDEGSSNEVYTNPNPDAYVELELLGPLQTMKVGDRFERANTYTLLKRTKLDPLDEARAQYPAR